MADIQNSFNKLYNSFLAARRMDAINLSLQAQQCREELQRVQQELDERKAEVERLHSELLAKSINH